MPRYFLTDFPVYLNMEKFPDLLPQLGMRLEISNGHRTMITVWEGEAVVCIGVGDNVKDVLRRAESWFWNVLIDRKIEEIFKEEL